MKTILLTREICKKSCVIFVLCIFFCNQIVGQIRTYRVDNKDVSIDIEKLIDFFYLIGDLEDISELEIEKVNDNYADIIVNSPYREPEKRMVNLDFNILLIHNWWNYGTVDEKEKIIEIFRDAAKNGNSKATYLLARYLCFETNDYTSFNEGAKWMKKAADEGDMNALTEVGLFYFEGRPWGKNNKLAEKYLLQSCSFPSVCAYYNMGCFYRSQGNLNKAEEYFKQCVNTKYEQKYRGWACANLAQMYEEQERYPEAFEICKKGVSFDDVKCYGYYGYYLYYAGQNGDFKPTEEDKREALQYLKKAADAGHSWSQMKYNDITSKNR